MLKFIAGLTVILVLSFALGHSPVSAVGTPGVTSPSVLEGVNKYRAQQSLIPLSRSSALDMAAAQKLDHMVDKQYWAHFGPDGETPWQFIEGKKYRYSRAGENLAIGFRDNQKLLQAWIDSPAHEANLTGSYSQIGIASKQVEIDGHRGILVVALFAEPEPTPSMSLFSYLSNLISIVRPIHI